MSTAFLKVIAGARMGLNVPLSPADPLVVGRKRGDLLLDDPLVSGTHAQFVPRDDGWVLQDLGSTNGTLVDGRLIREVVLRPGAEISIGSTKLVLFVGAVEADRKSTRLNSSHT
jgi:pSer/pThr/pTyr-binding forkhead associated (FHA) protein